MTMATLKAATMIAIANNTHAASRNSLKCTPPPKRYTKGKASVTASGADRISHFTVTYLGDVLLQTRT